MNTRLRVDPTVCTGYGICAELLPEYIDLDEWGYPIINPDRLPGSLTSLARRAVADCPALALFLEKNGKRIT